MSYSDDEVPKYIGFLLSDNLKTDTVPDDAFPHLVDTLHRIFCSLEDPSKYFERNLLLFGDHMEVDKRFGKYTSVMMDLNDRSKSIQHPEWKERIPEIQDKINQMMASVFNGREALIHVYHQQMVGNPELRKCLPPTRLGEYLQPAVETELKSHQKLIRYYLEMCRRNGFRKIAEQTGVFKPTFNQDGHYTHHYEYLYEISNLLHEMIYPYSQHRELFQWLTERANTCKSIAQYLAECRDDDFPFLERDRSIFSFRNGVFCAMRNQFFTYVPTTGLPTTAELSHTDVACNFIDQEFPVEYLHGYADPLDIPTPSCQTILDSQGFSREVCRWVYASLGRTVFPVGIVDQWQYIMYVKGVAGTGKSTLLQLAAKFYSPRDVGTLMSEGSRSFSVEHIYDKFVFYCYDADAKMNLSQTRFNQMVSGEIMSIERKFKTAKDIVWRAGGAMAGNAFPPWIDQAGNVGRRMLVTLFEKVVTKVDTKLQDKCNAELSTFLLKCVRCYLDLVDRHGESGIWDEGVLPPEFHRARRLMQSQSNPIHSFVNDPDVVRIDADSACLFSDFKAHYAEYCKQNNLTFLALEADQMAPALASVQAQLVDPRIDPNRPRGVNANDVTAFRHVKGLGLI